jgi:hypothetical protein
MSDSFVTKEQLIRALELLKADIINAVRAELSSIKSSGTFAPASFESEDTSMLFPTMSADKITAEEFERQLRQLQSQRNSGECFQSR